jgi:hypothetical protein
MTPSVNMALMLALVFEREACLFAMSAIEQGMQVQSEGHPESIDAAVSIFLIPRG